MYVVTGSEGVEDALPLRPNLIDMLSDTSDAGIKILRVRVFFSPLSERRNLGSEF